MDKSATGPGSLRSDRPDRRLDYDRRIRFEQLRNLHRYLPPILGVNVLVGCAMIYALWDRESKLALILWGAGLFGMVLIRMVLYAYYRRTEGR